MPVSTELGVTAIAETLCQNTRMCEPARPLPELQTAYNCLQLELQTKH